MNKLSLPNLNVFDEDGIDTAAGNRVIGQITCPMLIITADLDTIFVAISLRFL